MPFNLRALDLNLLPVFEAVYAEGSLSRAAGRLAMTQPAVSHALARLRATFRDELFVRHARGMTPTPAADALHARLADALSLVREAVAERRGFDPATSERRFAIALAHPLGPLLALELMASLAAAAPGVHLEFSTRSRPLELERAILEGRIDAAVDWMPAKTPGLAQELLFEDRFVAVARAGHPALRADRKWKDLVARRRFVTLRPRAEGRDHPVDAIRAFWNLDPVVALQVSEYLEVPVIASRSDLVGVMPRSVARQAQPLLGIKEIALAPAPKALPVRMLWRASREKDAALDFLRRKIRETAAKLAPGPSAR
jgi:DNA-binding transcriptional LysR family regulator